MLCTPSIFYLSFHMYSPPFPTLLCVLRINLHGMQRQVPHCHTSAWVGPMWSPRGRSEGERRESVYLFFWLPFAEILMHLPTMGQNCYRWHTQLIWKVPLTAWCLFVLRSFMGISWRQWWLCPPSEEYDICCFQTVITMVRDHLRPAMRFLRGHRLCLCRVQIYVKVRNSQKAFYFVFSYFLLLFLFCFFKEGSFFLHFLRVWGRRAWEKFVLQLPWR